MGEAEVEEVGEDVLYEEVVPDQLQERSHITPAEGMQNRGPTATDGTNVQIWTQNNKHSSI